MSENLILASFKEKVASALSLDEEVILRQVRELRVSQTQR